MESDTRALWREVEQLRQAVRRTRLIGTFAGLGCAALACAGLTTGRPPEVQDLIRARRIEVIDGRGVERVIIAAPLPDPMLLGKRTARGDAVSGILILDAEGNERGGYVTGDTSRDAALTLDELGRGAVHIGVQDRGDIHASFSNGRGGFATIGVLPAGAFMRLEGRDRPALVLPAPAEDPNP